jgi:[CysO sulfur-carrier protein]-S-L-cysteine hydrolase
MRISSDELREICEQAEAEYPNECCGVIMTRGDERRVVRFRNAQDDMHRIDPDRFPRTARKAYYVGLEDHKRMDALVAVGFATSIIYHSHPDAGAYFSATDREQAAPTPRSAGAASAPSVRREPVWPGVSYLVVSVVSGQAREFAVFDWDPGGGDFAETHKGIVVPSTDGAR